MVRTGLGKPWSCLLANDFDAKKATAYRANFGGEDVFVDGDIRHVDMNKVRSRPDLAWASFPCQDLSLAGNGAGLSGGRSGTFWQFMRRIDDLTRLQRTPRIIALENVYGTLKANTGSDFTAILEALSDRGYQAGALVIDAVHFLPQSRPRLFIVALAEDLVVPTELTSTTPDGLWHTAAIAESYERLSAIQRKKWQWWKVAAPRSRRSSLSDILESTPSGLDWNSEAETAYLLSLMSPANLAKVATAKKLGREIVGTLYRRTRRDATGERLQRAEVRFDGIAGCLRTPSGGSSRQSLLFVENKRVRSRLLSAREAARLMGLPEKYRLPKSYNDAYHLAGDGVAVPVVRHLSRHLLLPLASAAPIKSWGTAA